MPQKKLLCSSCKTIFNRKPKNGDQQVCWNCGSYKVAPITTKVTAPTTVAPPTSTPTTPLIPTAPDIGGFRAPVFTGGGGGGITPEMLLKAKAGLKKYNRPPVVLPGLAVNASPIPEGVRLMAYAVKGTIVQAPGIELELVWHERNSRVDNYAYGPMMSVDLTTYLSAIARGLMNPDHSNFNDEYGNRSMALPKRKGPRVVPRRLLQGITYFEYGWKRTLNNQFKWVWYNGGVRTQQSVAGNNSINSFLRNLRQSQVFCERLVIAETGEIFYTPDHYSTFFRYHPGTYAWYQYKSAGGAAGPTWDESFYEEPTQARLR